MAAPPSGASSSATSSPSSATVGAVPDCVGSKPGSSAATYDPQTGLYATYLKAVDVGARKVTFDVVQWLTGEAANRAYAAESHDTSGAPNDYYIVNASPKTYSAVAADSVGVRMLTGTALPLRRGAFADLAVHFADEGAQNSTADRTYWVRLEGGLITDICEQYRP